MKEEKQITFSGELTLEEAMDLSRDKLHDGDVDYSNNKWW